MRNLPISALAFLCLMGVSFTADLAADGSKAQQAKTILAFKTMYGVDGPFVGEENPIRGVNGDDLP
jgi:hypothetical protein